MQNVDFSPRLRRGGAQRTAPAEAPFERPAPDLRQRNRNAVLFTAGAILIFTLGLVAGIQIGRLKRMDESVVRYPDDRRPATARTAAAAPRETETRTAATAPERQTTEAETPATNSFANRSTAAPYIIKLGSFRTEEARRLAARLNAIAGLEDIPTARCRGVSEAAPSRGAAFRVRAEGVAELENVFAGCFASADRAQEALQKIQRSGLPGASRARLYEIE